MDYPLPKITINAYERAVEASEEFDNLKLLHEKTGDSDTFSKIFELRSEMLYHGTIALVMAVSALDHGLYRYACFKKHHNDVDKLFRNHGFVETWARILKATKNMDFAEDHPTRVKLTKLVSVRSKIVHQKASWITPETVEIKDSDAEWDDFRSTLNDLMVTMNSCLDLLQD